MRKLMWFTMGLGAACAFCAYSWVRESLLVPAAVFGIAFILGILIFRERKAVKAAAILCLGVSVGLIWFQTYYGVYLSRVTKLDEGEIFLSARCIDYGYETEYGSAVEGFVMLEGLPYRTKFYVNSNVNLEPGDVLEGTFRLRLTTNDSTEGATFHQGKGIFLLAYQEGDARLLKLEDTPLWAYPAILRQNLEDRIEQVFPADVSAFAKALLLGDRSGIDYATNTAFRVSGIMHIIAVSGLHVTILFTLINLLCLKRRWLVALVGIPVLVLFAAIVGFSPSVVRACIMQGLMILAMLVGRDYDGPTELSFAALVMLTVNPLVITSVSFQLSVGCIAGILLFNLRIYNWIFSRLCNREKPNFRRIKQWLSTSVAVTLSAMSLTTPLCAYYFGTVSLVGVLTNLLCLWVISFIFYGIILVCLLSFWIPGIAGFVAWIVAWPIRYVLSVSGLLAKFPLAAVYTGSVYIVAWLVFCYVLLAVFLLSKKKQPGLLLSCITLGLCLSLAASWLEPFTDACRMSVLNVGQGQSILLQSEGKTYLVDCGGDYDEDAADLAAETLLSQGISRIDGLILTHFDRDHAGGASYFLSRIPADMIFIPDYTDAHGYREKLEETYASWILPVTEDLQLRYGMTKICIFAPVAAGIGNESSLAVLFEHENCDILITGDRSGFGERMLLKTGQIPKVDVLVAGHHGADDSTSRELLDATRPGIVVISVGENHYGHPAPSVLERLEQYGCVVYRTDIHGNIILRR